MTEFFAGYKQISKSTKAWGHWMPYLLLGLAGNAVMWALALFYLQVAPRVYTSKWALSLPGTVTNTNLSLPDTANASSSEVSPYANTVQDPRESYKFIAASAPVQKEAATQLNIPPEEFGGSSIKIIDNTTLISFEIDGGSPDEAQKKALALHKAFEARLNELRIEEAAQREVKFQGKLLEAKKKLEVAQSRLADYQVRSGFASVVQIEHLSETIAKLRQQRAETNAQQQQSSASLKQLSDTLDISTSQASDALALKADQLVQQYMKDYSETTANLVRLSAKYLPNHPAVVQEQGKLSSIKAALTDRSVSLLGRPVDSLTLDRVIDVQGDSAKEALFKELFTSQVEQQEFKASAGEIDRQIAQLEERLKNLSRSASTVEVLKRDVQVSEALFSSTLASLDIRNSDVLGSYPEVQLVTEPSYADEPSSPKKKLVLLGAAFGTVFFSTGLFLIWLRSHQSRRKKKNVDAKLKGI